MSVASNPAARVWVLDEAGGSEAGAAVGIAQRLGVPFRRIELSWNWMAPVAALAPRGSLLGVVPTPSAAAGAAGTEGALIAGAGEPDLAASPPASPTLVISSGNRAAAVALWLKARHDCAVVQCMPPRRPGPLHGRACDLLVVADTGQTPHATNVLPVLGVPHRIGASALRGARMAWRDRLDYLPRPRVALLVGGARATALRGGDLAPGLAHALGRRVGRLASTRGGSVMATTTVHTGSEATEALAAGLGRTLHVLYRWGEPGENPYLGCLATADAIVVTADSIAMLSEACATTAPVFVAIPELAGGRAARVIAAMTKAGQVRPLASDIAPWPRAVLDEAGRVAEEIQRRFPLD